MKANKWRIHANALPSDPRWTRAVDLSHPASEKCSDTLEIPLLSNVLLHGLARGALLEASGSRSSGKTSICLHILARATQLGEVCAVVDFSNSFHPDSAATNGVHLDRLLWVRCERKPDYTMKATDLLLHAGGFGVVLLDLGAAQERVLRRIPISYWYRFQRAIQNTPTILLICTDTPQAKAASRYSLLCETQSFCWVGPWPFSRLSGLTSIVRQRKLAAIRPEPLSILVG